MRYLWSIVFSLCLCSGLKGQQQREWGKWESWGDQGNGTYMNPVIPSDYSDIDCIRVGMIIMPYLLRSSFLRE